MSEASVIDQFAAIDGDPWVSGPQGCATACVHEGMVVLATATGHRGNASKTAYTPANARRLAAFLIAAASEADASPPTSTQDPDHG